VDLLGTPFLLLCIALAVAAPAGAVLLWTRVRGLAALQLAQRVGLLVVCQLAAVLLAGVALNHQFAFYDSWSDLFGQDNQSAGAIGQVPTDAGRAHATTMQTLPGLRPIDGGQRVTWEDVTGPRSGVHASIAVVTPPGYADPAQAGRHYPVVVFLPGYPGTPSTWLHALDLQEVVDAEITTGRVPPFIAVLPAMNVAGTFDTECSDVWGGPRVATWLGQDVPAIVSSQVRTLPMGRDWAVAGYSTGGFCGAKLAFTYPRTYGSAAVIAGYFSPEAQNGAAGLFGGNVNVLHENDPMWLLTHGKAPAIRVLAVWSTRDPSTAGSTRAFLAAARPPLELDELRLSQGGHNTNVWASVLPQVLTWLAKGL
jgi:S-formylglutathione hydrolase FrmB